VYLTLSLLYCENWEEGLGDTRIIQHPNFITQSDGPDNIFKCAGYPLIYFIIRNAVPAVQHTLSNSRFVEVAGCDVNHYQDNLVSTGPGSGNKVYF
jgi:hypothetical protein